MALYLHRAGEDDVVVLDPSGEWLSTWETQFARLEINVLRSPNVHHPSPDVDGLSAYSNASGFMSTGLPYEPPTSDAFSAFGRHLVADAALAPPLAERAHDVHGDGSTLHVETGGPTITTERLVIAANPHHRVLPDWLSPLLGLRGVELAHAADVDLPAIERLDGEHVAIIGGGMTAAHLACGAAERGATAHIVSRRALDIRHFDTDPGWLGPKYLRAFDEIRDPAERLSAARRARGGGTIPPWMEERLAELAERGRVVLHPRTEVRSAAAAGSGCRLELDDGDAVEPTRVWLATGTVPDMAAMRCLRTVLPDIATIDGYPVTDDDLRTGRHPIHVMGRLATLTLGPAAGNLWGARHAAHRITRAITGIDVDFLATRLQPSDEPQNRVIHD